VPSITGTRTAEQHCVFWERLQPALHSGNEDFHLRFKGKKGSGRIKGKAGEMLTISRMVKYPGILRADGEWR